MKLRLNIFFGLSCLLLCLLAACLFTLKIGVAPTPWSDVWQAFDGNPEGGARLIANYRLPRMVAAMVVGIHLSISGLIMQVVLRNPLADPTIFGVSSGAALAVIGAMSFAVVKVPAGLATSASTDYLPLSLVPYIAFIGAVLATAVVMFLSYAPDEKTAGAGFRPARMALNGIVLAAILQGIVMVLVLTLSEARTELAVLWLTGSLYGRSFAHLLPVLPWTGLGFVGLLLLYRDLSVSRFDRQTALSLGLALRNREAMLVLLALALAASAVALAGPVGFVGLLVPHIARQLLPNSLPLQICAAIFIGAILVVAADTIGRVIASPIEVPVGIVTSLIGAPFFAYLINRKG
ncbi:FecCD family ABC transporter permease [Pseudophaeobacter sp.]|uniref:FecCD family ABC transporter permease n=1 Tax=Pseudophaeobacter sp. TaxID=1971739 RepID=UPI004058FA11